MASGVGVELKGYTYRFTRSVALDGIKGLPGAQRVSVNPLGYAPEASGIPQRVVADIASRIDQELARLNPSAAGGLVKGPKERAAAPRATSEEGVAQTSETFRSRAETVEIDPAVITTAIERLRRGRSL